MKEGCDFFVFENASLRVCNLKYKWYQALVWPDYSWGVFWIHFYQVSVPRATYSTSWGPDQYPWINKTLWSHQWIITSREKPSTKTIQKVKKNYLKPRKNHLKPKKSSEAKKNHLKPKENHLGQTKASEAILDEAKPKQVMWQ